MERGSGLKTEFEKTLKELVEIPTVSMEANRARSIRDGADYACELIKRFGGKARQIRTQGNPVVLGQFKGDPLWPTVTIYNHLDVQPAIEPTWGTDPFKFVKKGDRYFGRGTTDDKGPAVTALFACREAHKKGVPVNLNLLWELEEEIGSPNFEEAVRKARPELNSDCIVVSDTIWIARGKPAIAYALRGMITFTLSLRTGMKDVHSGLTGGAARNPVAELASVVSRLADAKTGRVSIPGFYRRVRKPTRIEWENFMRSGFRTQEFMRAHGFDDLRVWERGEVLRRIWCLPTLEVHGIVGGYAGPGVKTVVPQQAELKMSARLVPDQRPREVFGLIRKAVRRLNPDVRLELGGILEPFMQPPSGWYRDAARRAVRAAFGKEPAWVREGGSIGAVVTMKKLLGAPILLLGLSLPEHGYHAPNENFDWEQARGGMEMFFRFFESVGARRAVPLRRGEG